MVTELIRLPVAAGAEQALLDAIEGLPYFVQEGLVEARRFVAFEGANGVLLVFEWSSREASAAAIATAAGAELLAALEPHLTGPPELAFYEERLPTPVEPAAVPPAAAGRRRVVAAAAEVAEGHSRVVEVDGERLLLTKVDGVIRASSAWCTHARSLLGPFPLADGDLIECPLHGALFSARDGARLDGPTCAPLTVVEAEVDAAGDVVVDLDAVPPPAVASRPADTAWGAWGLDASALS